MRLLSFIGVCFKENKCSKVLNLSAKKTTHSFNNLIFKENI